MRVNAATNRTHDAAGGYTCRAAQWRQDATFTSGVASINTFLSTSASVKPCWYNSLHPSRSQSPTPCGQSWATGALSPGPIKANVLRSLQCSPHHMTAVLDPFHGYSTCKTPEGLRRPKSRNEGAGSHPPRSATETPAIDPSCFKLAKAAQNPNGASGHSFPYDPSGSQGVKPPVVPCESPAAARGPGASSGGFSCNEAEPVSSATRCKNTAGPKGEGTPGLPSTYTERVHNGRADLAADWQAPTGAGDPTQAGCSNVSTAGQSLQQPPPSRTDFERGPLEGGEFGGGSLCL